jgi:hypothetical protein
MGRASKLTSEEVAPSFGILVVYINKDSDKRISGCTYIYQLTNYERLYHGGINVMQLHRELACVLENAGLCALGILGLARRSRTAMTEDALDIGTTTAILTRRHARNEAKERNLFTLRFVIVLVSALSIVRAFLPQEMHITQFQLLDTINLSFVIVSTRGIDALSSSVACNDLVTVRRLVFW